MRWAAYLRENPPFAFAAAVLASFAYLVFVNLGYAPFWDDESVSAFLARNVVELGAPLADDGRNVFSYRGGGDIDDDLTFRYPKFTIYAQAAAFYLLGAGEWQARLVSALFAFLAILLFADSLRIDFPRRPGFAALALAFACFSPIIVLYSRSATYNAPALFFAMLLFRLYLSFCARPKIATALAAALAAVAGFYVNYLTSAAFVASLFIFHLLFRREMFDRRAWILAAVAAVPYAAHVLWFLAFEYDPEAYRSAKHGFTLVDTAKILRLHFIALNQNGMLVWPVALWFVVSRGQFLWSGKSWDGGFLTPSIRKKNRKRGEKKEKISAATRWQDLRQDRVTQYFVMAILQTLLLSLASPQSSDRPWAEIRFFILVAPFAAMPAALATQALWRAWRPLGVLLGAVLLLSDAAGWPFLKHRIRRETPSFTLPAYAIEFHRDFPDSMRAAMAYLREHPAQDDIVWVKNLRPGRPLFYLSDKLRLCCLFSDKSELPPALETETRPYLFVEEFGQDGLAPEWTAFFGGAPANERVTAFGRSYRLVKEFDGWFYSPATLQRPEPAWHLSFPPRVSDAKNKIKIYRLEAGDSLETSDS